MLQKESNRQECLQQIQRAKDKGLSKQEFEQLRTSLDQVLGPMQACAKLCVVVWRQYLASLPCCIRKEDLESDICLSCLASKH